MIGDLVSGHEPVGNQCVVRVVKRSVVGHFGSATVGVLAVSQKLVDRVERIRLNSVVSSEHDEHWRITLYKMSGYRSRVGTVCWLTGLIPPGGSVLAQWQSGSWHLEGSQEYPAEDPLLVGPLDCPSPLLTT